MTGDKQLFIISHLPLLPTMNKTITAIACVIGAIIAVMTAAGGQPMTFYTTTRWVIFAVCCWGVFQNVENPKKGILIGFILIGVIFNPIIPLRFKRDIWQVIDLATAIVLCYEALFYFKKEKQ